MKINIRVILILFVLAIAASSGFTQTISSSRKEILEEIVSSYQKFINTGDAGGLSHLFSPEAVYSSSDGPSVSGRERIGNSFDLLFKNRQLRLNLKVTDLVISDGLAYVKATGTDTQTFKSPQNMIVENEEYRASNPDYYKISDADDRNPLQNSTQVLNVDAIFIFRKRNGVWNIERLITLRLANPERAE